MAALARAHGEGRLDDKLTQFAKPRLLIVDELGYLPFEPNAAHLFLQPDGDPRVGTGQAYDIIDRAADPLIQGRHA